MMSSIFYTMSKYIIMSLKKKRHFCGASYVICLNQLILRQTIFGP